MAVTSLYINSILPIAKPIAIPKVNNKKKFGWSTDSMLKSISY